MKIAVTAKSTGPQAEVDERFGRAAYFVIYDTEADSWETVDNAQQMNAPQGAGVQAAQTMVANDVNVLLTGHCGPKAYRALSAAEIEVFNGATGTASDAVQAYNENRLEKASGPDVEGHW